MNILIDIGHPGQVHYFKNMIRILKKDNHRILIIARHREFIPVLLKKYGLEFVDRGKGSDGIFGKFLYMFKADYIIWKEARKFDPDLFLSFSSPYASQIAFAMGKPHIALNDTEHTDKMHSIFTYPFSDVILTPDSFLSNIGEKQIRFNNLIEGLYLHKNYFSPNKEIYKSLNLKEGQPYVVFRFVSWNAHHDVGQHGLSIKTKLEIIEKLKDKYKIFISSEDELPENLMQYKLPSSPELIHDVLYYADLFIGESSTMASESAFLGTSAVFINSLPLMCNIKVGQDLDLIKQFKSDEGVLDYISELICNKNLKAESQAKSLKLHEKFIDATQFLVWFVENYPESKTIMKTNPQFQLRFK